MMNKVYNKELLGDILEVYMDGMIVNVTPRFPDLKISLNKSELIT